MFFDDSSFFKFESGRLGWTGTKTGQRRVVVLISCSILKVFYSYENNNPDSTARVTVIVIIIINSTIWRHDVSDKMITKSYKLTFFDCNNNRYNINIQ